jgi:two-component system cell cycle sensor histidine kinase/response regulator CckA
LTRAPRHLSDRRITARFAIYALGVLLVVAAIGFALAQRSSTIRAKHSAIEQTRLVGAVVANQLEAADLERPVGDAQRSRLDSFFRSTMPDVPLVKIYSRTGRVTYSNDSALIGTRPQEHVDDARRLIAHGTYAEISHLDSGEKVIEAAVAIDANRDGRVDGGIEIYRDFTPVAAGIRYDFALSALTLAAALLLLYGALFPILRRLLRERSRSEAALHASEQSHRSLIETLPAIAYVNPLGELSVPTYVSPQIETVLGWTPAEWAADPAVFRNAIHPRDQARVLAACDRFRAKLDHFSEEYRLIARDGRIVWVLDQTDPVRDEAGKPLHLQGVLIDVTQRRSGEESLRESEQRFRSAFDSSALGMALTSRGSGILRTNNVLCSILGYEREELLGMSFAELAHPDDRERRLHDLAKLRSGSVDSYTAERRYVRKDGTWVWCRISVSAVRDGSGESIHDITQVQDVSNERALRESLEDNERLFRTLFAESLLAKIVLDDGGTIVDCNAAYAELVGLTREEIVGQPMAAVPASPELAAELWGRLQSEGELRTQLEFIRTDGRRREVDVTAKKDVLPGRHLAVISDLTEQKRLEQQVLQAHKMESVGRLAGGIAHDFNNLLTAIGGYTELMLRRIPEGSPLRHDAEEIRKAAERAANLTRQLLAFSRRQVLQPCVLDLNAVVVDMEKMLKRLIGEDVSLETRLEAELGAVLADPGQLQQVVLNLAVNAREALTHGGTVTIETSNVELTGEEAEENVGGQEGSYVLLSISDDGQGMDEAVRAQLFEPFFTTKEGLSTGLGLATVYGIVTQSGGYISVDSAPDAGSRFRLYLPRAESDAPVAVPVVQATGEAPRGAEMILLVEDEEIVRDLVKEMLTSFGYDVLEARNGREAIEISGGYQGHIDLVLSDVIMPGMSGPDAAREVLSQRPGTRVLFISGYTDSAIVHHGVLEPGTEFLQKPFNTEALARKVRAVLDGALAKAS